MLCVCNADGAETAGIGKVITRRLCMLLTTTAHDKDKVMYSFRISKPEDAVELFGHSD